MNDFIRIGSPQAIGAELAARPIVPGGFSTAAIKAGVTYLNHAPPFPLGTLLAFQLSEDDGGVVTIVCSQVSLSFPLPSPIGPGPIIA